MGMIEEFVAGARAGVARRSQQVPLDQLEQRLAQRPEQRPFREALTRPGLSLIAEFKRRSPSAGEIRPGATVEEIVAAYEEGGAAALSVLTDEPNFGGSLDDLRAARAACELPVLQKDFIVDPYQLYEAAAVGADAVLLIVAALPREGLARLHDDARGLDLDCVVEVHDQEELERALEIDAEVIGINNRNLDDFTVDLRTTFELITDVPAGKTVVSESGISERPDLEELERVGVDAVLVGEALMRAEDPEAKVRELTAFDEEATREHFL
jgi:indole-3-glycerol phosphate synthase